MKTLLRKSPLTLISTAMLGLFVAGCSTAPQKTLSGNDIKPIPVNIPVPKGNVLLAAVCVPDPLAVIEANQTIRYGKIFRKGFSSKRMKLGYPQKRNDRYWFVDDLGDLGSVHGFVLPDSFGKNQRLTFVWNVRDRRINSQWSPWLLPDYKVRDISSFVKSEWGLVGKEDFDKEQDKSEFLVKFRLISYYEYILEQINHWDIKPIESCEPVKKEVGLKLKALKVVNEDETEKEKEPALKRIIKEPEVSVE